MTVTWIRNLVGGAVWSLVYNAIWGVAGLGFMQREWTQAAESSGRDMPWTPDFLLVWVPLTLLFGVAIAAYLSSVPRQRGSLKPAVAATLGLWVPSTIGMLAWAGMSLQVFVLDSGVNLLATLAASLAAERSLLRRRVPVPHGESRSDLQNTVTRPRE
jgi:hypothetical protein